MHNSTSIRFDEIYEVAARNFYHVIYRVCSDNVLYEAPPFLERQKVKGDILCSFLIYCPYTYFAAEYLAKVDES